MLDFAVGQMTPPPRAAAVEYYPLTPSAEAAGQPGRAGGGERGEGWCAVCVVWCGVCGVCGCLCGVCSVVRGV